MIPPIGLAMLRALGLTILALLLITCILICTPFALGLGAGAAVLMHRLITRWTRAS